MGDAIGGVLRERFDVKTGFLPGGFGGRRSTPFIAHFSHPIVELASLGRPLIEGVTNRGFVEKSLPVVRDLPIRLPLARESGLADPSTLPLVYGLFKGSYFRNGGKGHTLETGRDRSIGRPRKSDGPVRTSMHNDRSESLCLSGTRTTEGRHPLSDASFASNARSLI